MRAVQTVTGPCGVEELGTTLMHEHLMIGWPGWQAEETRDRAARREYATRCIDRMAELRARGVGIVCATGLYKEDQGAPAYFKFRMQFGRAVEEMTEVFVRELTEGIGSTGIRAGLIKVATGRGRITPYEETVLRAAARAHRATGAPITTHTEQGTMGVEQLDVLSSEGVPPSAVVVGHSCGSSDLHYHLTMLDRGAFLGFDRFGLEMLHPDRERLAALIGLIGVGFARQIVLSHDSVWCWRGRAPVLPPDALPNWRPTYVLDTIVPRLREAGVGEAAIRAMLVDNPRRYFGGSGVVAT